MTGVRGPQQVQLIIIQRQYGKVFFAVNHLGRLSPGDLPPVVASLALITMYQALEAKHPTG